MRFALRILLQGAMGFCLLLLFNIAGEYIGINAGITWPGVALVATLGIPGFALLLLLQCMAL